MNLILTLGTGTAGRYSSLAEGMATTVRLSSPSRYWLVPSVSEDSVAIADLVRELVAQQPEITAIFEAWVDESTPYCCIQNPDDLNDCHQTLLAVIQRVRERAKSEGWPTAISVNPTSGTKQMSAGATLAALEADIEQISFTVGERRDGVVVTGTETLTSINSRALLGRRTLAESRRLIQAGSFAAARDLLAPYRTTSPACQNAYDLAGTLYHWQRLSYHEAVASAASSQEPSLIRLRKCLPHYAQARPNDARVVLDLLDSACFLAEHGFHEEALARAYRATEAAAKGVLERDFDTYDPFELKSLQLLCPRQSSKFATMAKNGKVPIGLRDSYEILDSLDHPLGHWYFGDPAVMRTLEIRNQSLYGHGSSHARIGPDGISPIVTGLREQLSVPPGPRLPSRTTFIREALNHS